jgi:hypothetical protein
MDKAHVDPDALATLAVTGGTTPEHVGGCERCRSDLEGLRETVSGLRALPDPPARLVEAAKRYYRRRRLLDALIERLAEDPALRARAKARPDQVLREAGLEATAELMEALTESDRGTSEVARRIAAKGWF